MGEAARDAYQQETGTEFPEPLPYQWLRSDAPVELGQHIVGALAGDVREMPEVLLRLEQSTHAGRLRLYELHLVREAFVRYADTDQAERFLRAASSYGAEELYAAADAYMTAGRDAEARTAWELCAQQGGAEALYRAGFCAMRMGDADAGREYLMQALATAPAHRKAGELMEWIG